METNNSQTKTEPNSGLIVHQVLAVSYATYLVAVILGFISDFIWPIRFSSQAVSVIGFICIVLGSFLAFWAQYVSGKGSSIRHDQKENLSHIHFSAGPYSITRAPTQYALLLLALGLALIYGSVVMVAMTLVAFVLGRFVFIPMEEHHLLNKYGTSYEEYKKKVRF